MIPAADKPRVLNLATRLAQTHRAGHLVFWSAEDWTETYGVLCERKDEDTVIIRVNVVGPGTLDPYTTKN